MQLLYSSNNNQQLTVHRAPLDTCTKRLTAKTAATARAAARAAAVISPSGIKRLLQVLATFLVLPALLISLPMLYCCHSFAWLCQNCDLPAGILGCSDCDCLKFCFVH